MVLWRPYTSSIIIRLLSNWIHSIAASIRDSIVLLHWLYHWHLPPFKLSAFAPLFRPKLGEITIHYPRGNYHPLSPGKLPSIIPREFTIQYPLRAAFSTATSPSDTILPYKIPHTRVQPVLQTNTMETRSSPAKAGKKRRANASGSGNKQSAKKASKSTKKVRTRNTKRDSDLVQMGNKPGRMIVIEKQPKDGSAFDPGSFVKQVSPFKLKLTRKATPKVDSSVAVKYMVR